MDATKVREVLSIYRLRFIGEGISKTDFPHGEIPANPAEMLAHCHRMLDMMEVFITEGRMDKVMRWLGFLQGVFWSRGWYSLEDLKNHNRPEEPVICDGCNIREPFEHRCHGRNIVVRGERADRSCECRPCAFAHLPIEEQEKLACANYLGIDPKRITAVKTTYDGGGHFTGISAIIHIPTGRELPKWTEQNLPKPTPEVA